MGFRHSKFAVLKCSIVFLSLAFCDFSSADFALPSQIQQDLQSEQLTKRRDARKELALEIQRHSGGIIPKSILERLENPVEDYRIRLGIADALGRLPEAWKSETTQAEQSRLYALMREEKDPSLKWALDRALMNSAGLYRDGVNDLNNDVTSNAVREKLGRVVQEFPQSVYAAKAQYYLGHFEIRAFLIGHPVFERGAELNKAVSASNSAFAKARELSEKSECELCSAVDFYTALNFLLDGETPKATGILNSLAANYPPKEIYIYQLFYTKDDKHPLDREFSSSMLASAVLSFINLHAGEDFSRPEARSNLAQFVLEGQRGS